MTEIISEDQLLTEFAVREHRSFGWAGGALLQPYSHSRQSLAIFLLTAIGAHFFWEYDPAVDLDYNAKLLAPTFVRSEESDQVHIFGTDKLGRDIFRRVVHGGWNSLRVGIIAVSISLLIGGILGLLAGFFESTHLNNRTCASSFGAWLRCTTRLDEPAFPSVIIHVIRFRFSPF